jgi:hypothetical protein
VRLPAMRRRVRPGAGDDDASACRDAVDVMSLLRGAIRAELPR